MWLLLLLAVATVSRADKRSHDQFIVDSERLIADELAELKALSAWQSPVTVSYFGQRKQFLPPERCSLPCEYVPPERAREANVLFVSTTEATLVPWKPTREQIRVATNTEALPELLKWLKKVPPFEVDRKAMGIDWVMDYRRTPRPDFWLPWLWCRRVVVNVPLRSLWQNVPSPSKLWLRPRSLPLDLVEPESAGNLAHFATFISAYSFGRDELVRVLERHFKIDHFGKLRRTRVLRARARSIKEQDQRRYNYTLSFDSKVRLLSHYRFTLAFDSTDRQDDWVTEKIFHALAARSLPVYYGARNIEDYLPCRGCVVHIRPHENLNHSLVLLKQLSGDRAAYLKYFRWLRLPVPARARELERYCKNNDNLDAACMACARMWNGGQPLRAQRLESYWAPVRMNVTLLYVDCISSLIRLQVDKCATIALRPTPAIR